MVLTSATSKYFRLAPIYYMVLSVYLSLVPTEFSSSILVWLSIYMVNVT